MKLKELFESPPRNKKWSGEQSLPVNTWGDVDFSHMNLKVLKDIPEKIFPGFICRDNKLTSLIGGPKWVGDFYDCSNNLLTTLEGAPEFIRTNFYCGNNRLTSLKGIHKQINYIDGSADFTNNPIKSHVLGVLRIAGLKTAYVDEQEVSNIINKHLKGDRDIFACQEELIEARFPEYAQL